MKTTLFPSTIHGLIYLLLASFLYYLVARLGIVWFTVPPGNINLLSLAAGIGLIMCLQWELRAFHLS